MNCKGVESTLWSGVVIFTSFDYLVFLAAVLCTYWLLPKRILQNALLLVCSYVFYGYIHPWFCLLIAASTIVDYLCGLGMGRFPHHRKAFLAASLACNLGMLGFFKYFNFFADNVLALMERLGVSVEPLALRVFLPVGISFYTFQTLSYTIDVYRGKLAPRRNFIDVALFVAFFPQLVAGPIERAARFLPQIEQPRRWDWDRFCSAGPLLVGGYLKKLVIADNVAVYVDRIFTLRQPGLLVLWAGALAFALQIYMDFSAYTDIARGSARLLGFDLVENFNKPYLAVSPSDFWRRWHISFSSWVRDYLYIPLGGSRVRTRWQFAAVLLVTLGLSGLWHGAAWHFVVWGVYHAVLVFAYHALGMGGQWRPKGAAKTFAAWLIMFALTVFGWMIFRAENLRWLAGVFGPGFSLGLSTESRIVSMHVLGYLAVYSIPLWLLIFAQRVIPNRRCLGAVAWGLLLTAIIAMSRDAGQDFIYFQF